MARTYHAEGRQLANLLRAIIVLLAVGLFYIGAHWGAAVGVFFGGLIFAEMMGSMWTQKRREEKKKRGRASRTASVNPHSSTSIHVSKGCRTDAEILGSAFHEMSWAEFERLLALYFRDQGYEVNEVGIGGNDGGVDLVIRDRRGEKTAVQAKCYADHHLVPVQMVRELVAAKRNHDCILTLLVTTSDLTGPAKKEAEQFKVDYWHGALLEQKLRSWGKWQPGKKASGKNREMTSVKKELSSTRKEVAVTSSVTCKCGAVMIKRKTKTGEEFYGCTTFPACRHTKSM